MEDIQDLYGKATLQMLTQFQFLELFLKAYIATAYRFIALRLDGAMHFGYSEKDLDSLSLERLLTIFCKLNANATLVARLNKLRAQRNHIAHKAMTIATGKYADIKALKAGLASYVLLQEKLSACIESLRDENRTLGNKFGAAQQAHFDAINLQMLPHMSDAP
jgi:hypothetical protein